MTCDDVSQTKKRRERSALSSFSSLSDVQSAGIGGRIGSAAKSVCEDSIQLTSECCEHSIQLRAGAGARPREQAGCTKRESRTISRCSNSTIQNEKKRAPKENVHIRIVYPQVPASRAESSPSPDARPSQSPSRVRWACRGRDFGKVFFLGFLAVSFLLTFFLAML